MACFISKKWQKKNITTRNVDNITRQVLIFRCKIRESNYEWFEIIINLSSILQIDVDIEMLIWKQKE